VLDEAEKNGLSESRYISNVLSLYSIKIFNIDDNNGFDDGNDDVCLEALDRAEKSGLFESTIHIIIL